jgi:tRNA (guanine6-N2)-methyltransferase
LIDIFAVTNRGLEQVSAGEMARLPGLQISQVGYRHINARYTGHAANLLALRTVDDIFIRLDEWHEIGLHRSTLALLEQLSMDLDLWQAVNVRSQIQPLSNAPSFSVSANFVGKRNYSADEIKLAVARGVEAISGWQYQEDDRESEINLRLFIEHEDALVGMRLGSSPLHRRAYKQGHVPGSLKPSVAAALLLLADVSPDITVLDPCCGAGTILIEAARLGAHAQGGDLDTEAVATAKRNASAAGVEIDVQQWDVRALPLADGSIERIVTNMPWGRQVEVEKPLWQLYRDACAEMERVLADGGRIVVLTNLPQLVTFSNLTIEKQSEISLFGQQPTIVIAESKEPAQTNTSVDVGNRKQQ